jgi:hypothetical protein
LLGQESERDTHGTQECPECRVHLCEPIPLVTLDTCGAVTHGIRDVHLLVPRATEACTLASQSFCRYSRDQRNEGLTSLSHGTEKCQGEVKP